MGIRVRADSVAFALVSVEPMTGIEPAYSAWEAVSMPNTGSQNACSEAISANSKTTFTCVLGAFSARLRYGAGMSGVRAWSRDESGTAARSGQRGEAGVG